MATVMIRRRKRKKKTVYQIYYKEPLTGQKKYYRTCQRLNKAQQSVNDLRALLDTGKLPEKKWKNIVLMTFEHVAASLKDEWDSRLSRRDLSPKTHEDYCIWLRMETRNFGEKLLCQMTRAEVETYRNKLASEYTNVTANKHLSVIKKVFAHSFKLNAVIIDPVADIPYLSEKKHERNAFLLPRKLDLLIEASKKNRAKFYLPAIIYLAAEHGASKQEILSLKWVDIDFEFGETGIIRLFRTKNGRERVEYIMPRAREALITWREHLEQKRKKSRLSQPVSGHVFCRIDGTPIKSFSRSWRTSLEEAGIEGFHFHDLRHTFASNLLLSGASLKDVKEMIGHSDISMTDRYSHLTLAHKLQKQSQLAEYYMNGAHAAE
ncbi:tyrosine-type recombinase/integrase [Thermodesulfobacteriota bacterium]